MQAIVTVLLEDLQNEMGTQVSTPGSTVSDDGGAEAEELLRQLGLTSNNADWRHNDVSDDEEDPMEWTPDPINLEPKSVGELKRGRDTVLMLVSVYGSTGLLLQTWRDMLGQRLLQSRSYDCQKEEESLQLLQARFGRGTATTHCQIMIQDLKDSASLVASSSIPRNFDILILSKQIWPPEIEKDDISFLTLKMPPNIVEILEVYEKEYEATRDCRKLFWHHYCGIVDITVTVKNISINITVTPIQLAVLLLFPQSETVIKLTIDEVCKELNITGSETELAAQVKPLIDSGVLLQLAPMELQAPLILCTDEHLVTSEET
eukprot:GHVL01032057.1.p1 GENE.GHVL01032057.1~~GHVL01032057.1.p1  ORF type:complete len:373 (+),score=86.03 GHVL01032057.1:163-1119(+)